jgi:SAM-dependent methyltransferase
MLLRCNRCTHVCADTGLSSGELGALYDESYFRGEEYLDYALEESALRKNFRRRLVEIARRCPNATSLWEVGTAYGYFLSEAAPAFGTVAGCDVSHFAVSQARRRFGLDIRVGDYLDIELVDRVDIVCLWDVVEHLERPQLTLEKAHRDLTPGGMVAFSTGDIGAPVARVRGAKWRLIHPPTHLHYFTQKSIRWLLQRIGFGELEVRYQAFWRSADALAYRLLSRHRRRELQKTYRVLNRSGLLRFSFPLNTFDIMTVYATKPRT